MKTLKFERIGESDFYNLFFDGKLYETMLTLEEVLKIISEKESEESNGQ